MMVTCEIYNVREESSNFLLWLAVLLPNQTRIAFHKIQINLYQEFLQLNDGQLVC